MTDPLIAHLESFITEQRKKLFNRILEQRTRYITVVLEDIYQPQNASAVLRTSDCFGIQDVHIIENRNDYMVNPDVTLGADKWLDLHKYNTAEHNSASTIETLREKGYRIVATIPRKPATNLRDFDLRRGKTAIFFGTELTGLSEQVLNTADEFLQIPLHGFTESFNISVSAAIVLHFLSEKLRQSDLDWKLSPEEKKEVKLNWLRQSVKNSNLIEKEFLSKYSHNHNIADWDDFEGS